MITTCIESFDGNLCYLKPYETGSGFFQSFTCKKFDKYSALPITIEYRTDEVLEFTWDSILDNSVKLPNEYNIYFIYLCFSNVRRLDKIGICKNRNTPIGYDYYVKIPFPFIFYGDLIDKSTNKIFYLDSQILSSSNLAFRGLVKPINWRINTYELMAVNVAYRYPNGIIMLDIDIAIGYLGMCLEGGSPPGTGIFDVCNLPFICNVEDTIISPEIRPLQFVTGFFGWAPSDLNNSYMSLYGNGVTTTLSVKLTLPADDTRVYRYRYSFIYQPSFMQYSTFFK